MNCCKWYLRVLFSEA
jgi:hypothetical protein